MHYLAALLPLTAFILLTLVAAAHAASWRLGLLHAFIGMGLLVLVTTELLSLVSGLSGWAFAAVDIGIVIGATVALRAAPRLPPTRRPRGAETPWLVVLGMQLAVLLVLALAAVPNNWDSMVYHLAKVAHWASAGSLDHYATTITPQLYLGPLAEYEVLHLYLLTGGDRLANLVQLLAHVVCVVGVSQVAKNLGLPSRAQLAAAVVAASIPMAVAQAVTTQNDYVVAAFLVSGVAVGTQVPRPRNLWLAVLPAAVAFGLAVVAKATAALFGLPLAVWVGWRLLRRAPAGRLSAVLGAAVLVALALNAGWLLRNGATFGDPLGPEEPALRMESVTPGRTVGNVVRNAGHNLALPGLAAINTRTTSVLRGTMSSVGIDPDDADSLFAAETYDIDAARNEDRASSPLPWLLLLAGAGFAAFDHRARRSVGGLVLSLATGYLLFSAVLKWQPWGARLLLPLLVLGSVVAAAMLARLPRALMHAALVVVMVASLPWLLTSQYRPLVGDTVLGAPSRDVLFRSHDAFRKPYLRATAAVRASGEDRVGLVTTVDGWEYPFWRLLPGTELVQVDVRNETRVLGAGRRPVVVICVCHRRPPPGWTVTRYGRLVQIERRLPRGG